MLRTVSALGLTLALALPAFAQEAPAPRVELEAGVADFNRDLSRQLGLGPSWGVRALVPLGSSLSLVIGYQGAALRVVAESVEGTPWTLSNGGFAALQLEAVADWPVRPYAFLGAGLLRTTVPAEAESLLGSDTAGIVPVGFGVEGSLSKHFRLGARLSYDLVFDNELIRGAGSLAADLWSLTLAAAYAF
ncbi:MAG: outer membrane beta-barrel protein [Myxococcales bacterium]|jgi:hypothetical protein